MPNLGTSESSLSALNPVDMVSLTPAEIVWKNKFRIRKSKCLWIRVILRNRKFNESSLYVPSEINTLTSQTLFLVWTHRNMGKLTGATASGLEVRIGTRGERALGGKAEWSVGGAHLPAGLASDGGGTVNLEVMFRNLIKVANKQTLL